MKKSEILENVFGGRVIHYYRIEGQDLLVVFVEDLTWVDFTTKFVSKLVDIQANDKNSIRVCLEVTDWD